MSTNQGINANYIQEAGWFRVPLSSHYWVTVAKASSTTLTPGNWRMPTPRGSHLCNGWLSQSGSRCEPFLMKNTGVCWVRNSSASRLKLPCSTTRLRSSRSLDQHPLLLQLLQLQNNSTSISLTASGFCTLCHTVHRHWQLRLHPCSPRGHEDLKSMIGCESENRHK